MITMTQLKAVTSYEYPETDYYPDEEYVYEEYIYEGLTSKFNHLWLNYSSDYLYEEEAEDEETATDNTMIYQSIFLIILLIGAGILTYMIYRKHDDAKKEREYVEKHSGQLPGV